MHKSDSETMALYQSVADRVRYEDGILFWVRPCQNRNIGKQVGRLDRHGYLHLHPAKGRMISVHRLVFFIFYGRDFTAAVDALLAAQPASGGDHD